MWFAVSSEGVLGDITRRLLLVWICGGLQYTGQKVIRCCLIGCKRIRNPTQYYNLASPLRLFLGHQRVVKLIGKSRSRHAAC
jgi:hypothetical protein